MNLARTIRLAKLRPAILALAAAVVSVLAASSLAAPAHEKTAHFASDSGSKPVIVLEHGAWADASSWDKVIAEL